jgi:hypothetical protein
MSPTRPALLVAVFLLAGGLAYLLSEVYYASVPPLPGYAPATLFVLALAEAYSAYVVRQRLPVRRMPPAVGHRWRPLAPIAVARIAALAKASSLVGAVAAGGYGGLLLFVLVGLRVAPTADRQVAALGLAAGLLLAAAALALESSCRVRRPPDDRSGDDGETR